MTELSGQMKAIISCRIHQIPLNRCQFLVLCIYLHHPEEMGLLCAAWVGPPSRCVLVLWPNGVASSGGHRRWHRWRLLSQCNTWLNLVDCWWLPNEEEWRSLRLFGWHRNHFRQSVCISRKPRIVWPSRYQTDSNRSAFRSLLSLQVLTDLSSGDCFPSLSLTKTIAKINVSYELWVSAMNTWGLEAAK